MRINNTAAFALAGVIALTLAGCGETLPPPTPSEPPEATGALQPAVAHGFTFAELRQYKFVFASGAGSWGTVLYVRPDGSFSGTFSDTTWEEYGGSTRAVLLCSEFTGQFTEPVRVNDYTYSVRIARIDYERAVGGEAFADGFHYYYTEPRGLEDTEELLIYLPGAPLGELPQEFRGWVDHGDQGEALLSYALNNEAHQQGFFSRNLVREIIYSLISARDESGELEQQLQDATLSQEERETKAEELYQVWDNELNEVWDALNRLLSPEDMEVLTAEELEWIAWKEEQAALAGAGISLRPLCRCRSRCLVLVYRRDRLERQLDQEEVARLLERDGYPLTGGLEAMLDHLASRMAGSGGFPHEVGLVLGSHAEDVEGFRRHGGQGYKYSGLLKVYSDVERAQRGFRQYGCCRRALCRRLEAGCRLVQLFRTA